MKNNQMLKGAIVAAGEDQKKVAADMGLNIKTFYNKINLRTRKGRVVRFNEQERAYLAERFGINKKYIQ